MINIIAAKVPNSNFFMFYIFIVDGVILLIL